MPLKKKMKAKGLSRIEMKNAELEAKLSPEARAVVEEFRAIRKSFGKLPFMVADLIREIREGND
jgi:hypothetical protein